MHELPYPRVYTSFAEFTREERARLGLDPLPLPLPKPLPAVELPVAKKGVRRAAPVVARVTPASLRAEGVLEVGCAPGTSILFVRTRVKLHLLHSTALPDRALDDYAVMLAVNWIEDHGLASGEVAKNLGVSQPTLRLALNKAGYARLGASDAQHAQRASARASRKVGNRRGRLMRVSTGAAEAG